MQLFAHIGITLGAAWVIQQAVTHVRSSVMRLKPSYNTANTSADLSTNEGSSQRSTASWLNYWFLALGSLLPDIVDKPLALVYGGGRDLCHTLVFIMLILTVGALLYRIRKSSWLLCIALGCVAHVLLDAMWLKQSTFLWPLFGWGFQHPDLSIGTWIDQTVIGPISKPSGYIPEAIGFITLGLFYFGLVRNGKISRFIKSVQFFFYRNFFSVRKPKHMASGLALSKGTMLELGRSASLMEKPAE
jgi:inner membrane protein